MRLVGPCSHEGITEATVKDLPINLLINLASGDAIEVKLLVWISSVYEEPEYKSALLARLIASLSAEQIKLV